MQARYRKDYPGEFVIFETKWTGGKKEEKREWIENPIVNQHISGRAAVIGSSESKDRFDYTILEDHRGGLLGSLSLQTYGTAAISKEMRLDFTVDTDFNNLLPLIENNYTKNHIVYTNSKNCVRKPGEFYLIPYNPLLCTTVLPIYLAAFDGHKEIFMIGYDKETNAGQSNWINQVTKIIKAYSGTSFIMVGNELNMPNEWLSCPNAKCFNFRDFVTHCDV